MSVIIGVCAWGYQHSYYRGFQQRFTAFWFSLIVIVILFPLRSLLVSTFYRMASLIVKSRFPYFLSYLLFSSPDLASIQGVHSRPGRLLDFRVVCSDCWYFVMFFQSTQVQLVQLIWGLTYTCRFLFITVRKCTEAIAQKLKLLQLLILDVVELLRLP